MKQTVILSTCVASLIFALCSCTTPKPYQSDVSAEAYEKAMAESDRLDLPRQSYEDWRLFREQDKLRTLYLDLLGIDPEEAMAEFDKAYTEYQQAYDTYRQEKGVTNDDVFGDFAQETALHREFEKQFTPTHTNHASAIMIVWEGWCEFVEAEKFFRKRIDSANIRPKDAFDALRLSDRHRRAIGQWEAQIGITREAAGAPDLHHPKPKRLEDIQRVAREQLANLHSDANQAPYTAKLRSLATEELTNADKAWAEGDEAGALQWSRDAIVTAESARALFKIEGRTSR